MGIEYGSIAEADDENDDDSGFLVAVRRQLRHGGGSIGGVADVAGWLSLVFCCSFCC